MLWNVNGEIIYSDGPLSITPLGDDKVFVKRHFYHIPYTNVMKGGFIHTEKGKMHVPSYTLVHPGTTHDDLILDEPKFKSKPIESETTWKFKSSSNDKEYTVRRNKNGNLSCDCWGYIAHKKCKHIKQVNN